MTKNNQQKPSAPTCWEATTSMLERSPSSFLTPRRAPKPDTTTPPYVAPVEFPAIASPTPSRTSSISIIKPIIKKRTFRGAVRTIIQRGLLRTKRALLCAGGHECNDDLPPARARDEKAVLKEEASLSGRRISNPISVAPPPAYRISEISLAPTYKSMIFPDSSGRHQNRNTWMGFPNEAREQSTQIHSRQYSIRSVTEFDANDGEINAHLLTSRFSATTVTSSTLSSSEPILESPICKHTTWPMARGDGGIEGEPAWIMTGIENKDDLQKRLAEYLDERLDDYASPTQVYGYI